MDTIDSNVMQDAEVAVHQARLTMPIIHTVTITLNGQHGGADLLIEGYDSGDEATFTRVELKR